MVWHLSAAITRSLPTTAVAMRVTGTTLLGSFGLEHCSSEGIHMFDQDCDIGLIQDYATNVLSAVHLLLVLVLIHQTFVFLVFLFVAALSCLLRGNFSWGHK